jgi:hypothetical protein
MLVNLSPKEQELLDHAAQGVAAAQRAAQAAMTVLPEHLAVVDAHARLAAACDVILSLSGIDPAGAELQINAETGAVEIHTSGPEAPQTFRPEVVSAAPTDPNAPTEV